MQVSRQVALCSGAIAKHALSTFKHPCSIPKISDYSRLWLSGRLNARMAIIVTNPMGAEVVRKAACVSCDYCSPCNLSNCSPPVALYHSGRLFQITLSRLTAFSSIIQPSVKRGCFLRIVRPDPLIRCA